MANKVSKESFFFEDFGSGGKKLFTSASLPPEGVKASRIFAHPRGKIGRAIFSTRGLVRAGHSIGSISSNNFQACV